MNSASLSQKMLSQTVWMVMYDSESHDDRLEGIYATKELAMDYVRHEMDQINELCKCESDFKGFEPVKRSGTRCFATDLPGFYSGFYYIVPCEVQRPQAQEPDPFHPQTRTPAYLGYDERISGEISDEISDFYHQLVADTMTGKEKYLSAQHKIDFVEGVKGVLQYAIDNNEKVDGSGFWLPFFLWNGDCDQLCDDQDKIFNFVEELVACLLKG